MSELGHNTSLACQTLHPLCVERSGLTRIQVLCKVGGISACSCHLTHLHMNGEWPGISVNCIRRYSSSLVA